MSTIHNMHERFKSLDIDKVALETMEASKEVMADLNAEQINRGIRSDGSLMPDYSRRSVEEFGKPQGPIRLRDQGDFQAGFYVKVEGKDLVYGSTDSKTAMLIEGDGYRNGGYGEDVFGLSEKFQNEAFIQVIRPEFKKNIEQATKLKVK